MSVLRNRGPLEASDQSILFSKIITPTSCHKESCIRIQTSQTSCGLGTDMRVRLAERLGDTLRVCHATRALTSDALQIKHNSCTCGFPNTHCSSHQSVQASNMYPLCREQTYARLMSRHQTLVVQIHASAWYADQSDEAATLTKASWCKLLHMGVDLCTRYTVQVRAHLSRFAYAWLFGLRSDLTESPTIQISQDLDLCRVCFGSWSVKTWQSGMRFIGPSWIPSWNPIPLNVEFTCNQSSPLCSQHRIKLVEELVHTNMLRNVFGWPQHQSKHAQHRMKWQHTWMQHTSESQVNILNVFSRYTRCTLCMVYVQMYGWKRSYLAGRQL